MGRYIVGLLATVGASALLLVLGVVAFVAWGPFGAKPLPKQMVLAVDLRNVPSESVASGLLSGGRHREHPHDRDQDHPHHRDRDHPHERGSHRGARDSHEASSLTTKSHGRQVAARGLIVCGARRAYFEKSAVTGP